MKNGSPSPRTTPFRNAAEGLGFALVQVIDAAFASALESRSGEMTMVNVNKRAVGTSSRWRRSAATNDPASSNAG